jgi:hypothetical protein
MNHPGAEPVSNPTPRDAGPRAPASPPGGTAYALASGLFAGLLLVAAGLKADLAFNDPIVRSRTGEFARHLLAALTEAGVAAWLLSGVAPAWARRAAIALLSVFVAVSGWHLLRGDVDCGCFGRVRVHPAWTVAIDAAALASVWFFGHGIFAPAVPAGVRPYGSRPRGVRIFLAVLAGLGVPALTVLFAADPFKPQSETDGAIDAVILDPRGWDGKPFPLLGELAPSDPNVAKGKWVVILVNHACHKCEEYLAHADFEALRQADGPGALPRSLGLIEFRLPEGEEGVKVPGPVPVAPLRLRKGPPYLIDGPYEVYLNDGMVERTRRAY